MLYWKFLIVKQANRVEIPGSGTVLHIVLVAAAKVSYLPVGLSQPLMLLACCRGPSAGSLGHGAMPSFFPWGWWSCSLCVLCLTSPHSVLYLGFLLRSIQFWPCQGPQPSSLSWRSIGHCRSTWYGQTRW